MPAVPSHRFHSSSPVGQAARAGARAHEALQAPHVPAHQGVAAVRLVHRRPDGELQRADLSRHRPTCAAKQALDGRQALLRQEELEAKASVSRRRRLGGVGHQEA